MHYAEGVEYVLVATDSDDLFDDVDASLGDDRCEVGRVNSGAAVFGAVRERQPDLVVLDLQIGNMGGMATSLHLRNEAGGRSWCEHADGRVDEGEPAA